MFGIPGVVEYTCVLPVSQFGDASFDMMVKREGNGTVGDSFVPMVEVNECVRSRRPKNDYA